MNSVIAVVLVLGGLIFFHELGHFIAARFLGIGVKSFSLGFGPVLLKLKRGMTEYRLSLLPLGGYVSLAGEQPEAVQEDTQFPEQERFMLRPAWHRLIVVAAGPIFNFVLGWLIYWAIFLGQGQVTVYEHPVEGVLEGSPAMQAGIEKGDVLLKMNGRDFYSQRGLIMGILFSNGDPVSFTVERGNEIFDVSVQPTYLSEEDKNDEVLPRPKIGVEFSSALRDKPLGPTLGSVDALHQTLGTVDMTIKSFVMIITGKASFKAVGGPIMIVQTVGQQARAGFVEVLLLAALISVNLGILNLLPIPVLDGGHILFFGFEAITGKAVNESLRHYATMAGMGLLLMLMALTFYNDLYRIFTS